MTSDQKRNFFAHSGLSSDLVKVKKEGGQLYLSYKDGIEKAIKSWLDDPS